MDKIFIPPIKCQGIKTKLVPWVKAVIPEHFSGVWVEPFMGSGVVAFNIRPQKAILSDSNPHLIAFYKAVQTGEITAQVARHFLVDAGQKLYESGGAYYYEVRERFTAIGNSLDFLFLNRACFNGMIRFNRKGGFNVPFCRKPNRFAQAYITKICNQIQNISNIIQEGSYQFYCQNFEKTIELTTENDLIYCDPPYIDRHADYFNGWTDIQEKDLKRALAASKAQFILSTWHSNDYRENTYLKTLWAEYNCLTREHFYHVGAKEKNRNPILEALVSDFQLQYNPRFQTERPNQLSLLDC